MNVKDFGALGDGKTNDTSAFQKAITYCTSNNESLYIPSGKYYINKPLKNFNFISIYGEGRTSEILLDLKDGQYCFDAYSNSIDNGWVYSLIIKNHPLTFIILKVAKNWCHKNL
ncbi:glycosyl hydrolase family 28-related protein [Terrisporobacter sp.]